MKYESSTVENDKNKEKFMEINKNLEKIEKEKVFYFNEKNDVEQLLSVANNNVININKKHNTDTRNYITEIDDLKSKMSIMIPQTECQDKITNMINEHTTQITSMKSEFSNQYDMLQNDYNIQKDILLNLEVQVNEKESSDRREEDLLMQEAADMALQVRRVDGGVCGGVVWGERRWLGG